MLRIEGHRGIGSKQPDCFQGWSSRCTAWESEALGRKHCIMAQCLLGAVKATMLSGENSFGALSCAQAVPTEGHATLETVSRLSETAEDYVEFRK